MYDTWVEEPEYGRHNRPFYEYCEERMAEIKKDVYACVSKKVGTDNVEEYLQKLIQAYKEDAPGSECLEEFMDPSLDIPAVLGDIDDFADELQDSMDYREGDDE